jgi:hypothetical protein
MPLGVQTKDMVIKIACSSMTASSSSAETNSFVNQVIQLGFLKFAVKGGGIHPADKYSTTMGLLYPAIRITLRTLREVPHSGLW